ncbi:MAG: DUF4465 domain-containing protein, partial [Bacteroidota bacterium]
MKQLLTLIVLLGLTTVTQAQSIIDFEDFQIEADSFLNGQFTETPFISGNASFENIYSTDFGGFWASGWAISSSTDSTTGDFTNLYGAITGSGHLQSGQYAIGQNNAKIDLLNEAAGKRVLG